MPSWWHDEPKERDEMEDKRPLTDALIAAQTKMKHAKMDRVNPHFKNRYATLASVLDACKAILNAEGIFVGQTLTSDPAAGTVGVRTILRGYGESLDCGELVLKAVQNNPQQIGSALTYARRYALAAAVGIASDEDDDGEAASAPPKTAPPAPSARPAAAPTPPAPRPAAAPTAPASDVGDFTFAVGKHRGQKASEVPAGYLEWYADAKEKDPSKWEGQKWEQRTRDEIRICRALVAAHEAGKDTPPAPPSDEPPPPDAPPVDPYADDNETPF